MRKFMLRRGERFISDTRTRPGANETCCGFQRP
jgi:hypothetical protein